MNTDKAWIYYNSPRICPQAPIKVSNLSEVKSEKIKSKLIKFILVEYQLENILDFYEVEGLSDD